MDIANQRYFSSHTIAKLIHVSPSSVLGWIDKGLLAAHRTPGGHRRVERGELVKFLRTHEMPVPRELAGLRRVLIVDGDKAARRRLERQLTKLWPGLEVEHADTSTDALLAIGIERPDAVLIDAHMASLDVVDVCRRLAGEPATRAVRVVPMSDDLTRRLRDRLTDAGAASVLEKPVNRDALEAALS